jgi:hypothetical protein
MAAEIPFAQDKTKFWTDYTRCTVSENKCMQKVLSKIGVTQVSLNRGTICGYPGKCLDA